MNLLSCPDFRLLFLWGVADFPSPPLPKPPLREEIFPSLFFCFYFHFSFVWWAYLREERKDSFSSLILHSTMVDAPFGGGWDGRGKNGFSHLQGFVLLLFARKELPPREIVPSKEETRIKYSKASEGSLVSGWAISGVKWGYKNIFFFNNHFEIFSIIRNFVELLKKSSKSQLLFCKN